MPLALFPGIRYDALEPPPPGPDPGHIDALYMHGDHNGWEPPDARPRCRPRGRVNAPHGRRRVVGGAARLGNHDQEPQEEGFLPPQSTSVKAQVIHDTAKFTISQVFENQSRHIKQGVYQFPLPLDATVMGFDCRIGPNKIIRGKVKERNDAQYEFDEARRQGRTGGLMEQQTAEIFTITLANIPSRTKMQAELSFMCLLKHRSEADHQVFTLTLPTFIAPRYGDVPPGIRMPTRDSHFLSVGVDVLAAEDIRSVESETHAIRYTLGAGPRPCQTWDEFITGHDNDAADPRAATVELENRLASLDRDLVITINTALSDNAEAPQACLETHPTLGNHQALMLTLPPELMTAGVNSTNHGGEIIFLADRSGSMVDKIDSLKSAMMFFINGIPENQTFNIWCFGSGYTYLWPRSRCLDEASRQEAIAYIRNEFASDMGGTAILPALEEICSTMGAYPTMDVIVLTDGQVWSAPETIGFVRSRRVISRGAARFFSLGIGDAVSHELVEGIAKAGGGYAEVIVSASSGGWEDRVVAVLNAAMTGHTSRLFLSLEWEEHDSLQPPSNFKQSPVDVSNLSPFLRNRIFLLFDSGQQHPELKHVVLQVQSPNGSVMNKTILPRRLSQPDTLIHKLAVRALLGDLERGESWLGVGRGSGTDDPMIRAEAINLGCKWSLVSIWTSIYAIEEEMAVPNGGMIMEMEIPEAADELNDALLLPRGGRAAANPRLRLPRPESAAEESGSESDNSESSLGTRSAGQSVADNNSDDDSDDGADNPGFNSNTRPDTGPGPGRESPRHRQADQPGERQAPPDMPQGESCTIEALQPGGEQPSGVMRHSNGWNPTPRPEDDASSSAQIPSPPAFRKPRYSKRREARPVSVVYGPRRAIRLRKRDEPYSKRSRRERSVGTVSPGDVASIHPSSNTLPTAVSSVQPAIDSIDLALAPSTIPAQQQIAFGPTFLPSNVDDSLQATLLRPSSDTHRDSGPQTNIATGAVSGSGPTSDDSLLFFDDTQFSQPVYPPLETGDLLDSATSQFRFEDPAFTNIDYDTSSNYWDFSSEPWSFGHSSTSEAASAPIFNPPASTSLVQYLRPAAKSPDELAAEQLIRQLVLVQLSDGRFSFSDEDGVKTTLGLSFLFLVTSLRRKINSFDPAVTIAIVALLKEQFHACQDLWVLMVRKAEDYITRCNLGAIVEELQHEAREGVRSIGSVIKELKDGEVITEAVIELESAPVS
ncbi:hypothetical protein IL306_014785 [Fusarium sp. DS 682]|nr:hypothetical protein IL306_014785 [Fusarium sp. DS 682]